ncbi:MAG: acyl-CoA desaturase, partial [Bacteroidota bacterium]
MISFDRTDANAFYKELRRRIDHYFESNDFSVKGNRKMLFKATLFLSIYILLYCFLLTGWYNGLWVFFGIWIGLGFVSMFAGLNIGHDAVHGAFSENRRVNFVMGHIFNFIGANDYMWDLIHNKVHHNFTNIDGHDLDINHTPLVRMSPHQPLWFIHRYQHIYTFFLYALTTIEFAFAKDYYMFFRKKLGPLEVKHTSWQWLRLLFFKLLYYTLFLVLPTVLLDYSFWQVLLGFLMMHLVAGFILSIIFNTAHLVEDVDYPLPDDHGQMEHSWAIHQLYTTVNYATENWWVNFFFGGLNFQVEHHLFPHICHIHYPEIAPIVRQTCQEYGLPYFENPGFFQNLRSHARHLRNLGRPASK